ncbi:Surface antigen [Mucilaginibacter pineti]|uniref:Surface antigen n=1 Tax=Mucilaginibacter pineti TaxID=1391627 RepID=A0A1G7D3Q0_9SPHI|nr:BamA/TamA family outer membrane protein [Mucilaginibacter pineti]SDE45650.1 Surface antigen [Mucilaginibacter pineti]
MKTFITTIILLFCLQTAFSQTHIIPKFIRKMYFDRDSSKKSSFIILPVLSSAPETGLEAGGAGLLSFYTDTVSKITRVSNIFGYATFTTKGQSRVSLNTSYWTPQNKYHLTAGVSYINFPFNFYGIGNNTRSADVDRIGQKRVKINLAAEKKLTENLYGGLVAGASHYSFSSGQPNGIFYTDPQVYSRSGGSNAYIGPSLSYDSRDNNTYTTSGIIVNTYFEFTHGLFSSNDYKGGFFNIEYAQFFKLSQKFVLGIDIQEQSLTGSQSPFFLLPALGSDEMMRGYYNGRYRDRNMLAGQTELRYRLSNRIGLAGFIGTGEVFHNSFSFAELKPNYGGGLRYFFDVEKGLSVRMDYGVGQKNPGESRQSGFYIGLGQAF